MLQSQTCYYHFQGCHHVYASIVGFWVIKCVIRRGITIFKSYLEAKYVILWCPIKIFTTHNDLNEGSSIIVNKLRTWSKFSKLHKLEKKCLRIFTIFLLHVSLEEEKFQINLVWSFYPTWNLHHFSFQLDNWGNDSN